MFVRFNANPVNKNTGDCTVRAISVLMSQSQYESARQSAGAFKK